MRPVGRLRVDQAIRPPDPWGLAAMLTLLIFAWDRTDGIETTERVRCAVVTDANKARDD